MLEDLKTDLEGHVIKRKCFFLHRVAAEQIACSVKMKWFPFLARKMTTSKSPRHPRVNHFHNNAYLFNIYLFILV